MNDHADFNLPLSLSEKRDLIEALTLGIRAYDRLATQAAEKNMPETTKSFRLGVEHLTTLRTKVEALRLAPVLPLNERNIPR